MTNIKSFSTGVNNTVYFTFTDDTTAFGVYNPKTGMKIRGDSNAPNVFVLNQQTNPPTQSNKNVVNLNKLRPDNFITNNNIDANYKTYISAAVQSNKPDILACLKDKMRNITGQFTIPTASISIPQIQLPSVDVPSLIQANIQKIKTSISDVQNAGKFSVSKFIGCTNLKASTPYEKRELAISQVRQEQIIDQQLLESTDTLNSVVVNTVIAQTEAIDTAQDIIPTLSTV